MLNEAQVEYFGEAYLRGGALPFCFPNFRFADSKGVYLYESHMSGQLQMKDGAKTMLESPPLWQRVIPHVIIRWATRTQSTSA